MKKNIIVIVNILLLVIGVLLSAVYSNHLSRERTKITEDAFKSTVEAMIQVSMGQLNMQQEHVNNWRDYINSGDMSTAEVMDFLTRICADDSVQAQIIDPETLTGASTKENIMVPGDYTVNYADYYLQTLKESFSEMAEEDKSGDYLYVTRVFVNPIDGMQVVAFGRGGVRIRAESGEYREYLLLRLIHLDKLKAQWVFPSGYEDAEISLVTQDGSYIIRSKSMKSENFYEFIRAYNGLTYPQKDALQKQMTETASGVLEYKNARGKDSYWAYAGFQGNFGDWMIIGYVPADSVNDYGTEWSLIIMVVGILLLLFLIDGIYFMHMNKMLRLSMEQANGANKAKTRFLSSMSHDIRTPLNAIIGMTTIAKAQFEDKERLWDCLDKITLASNHLLTLINDILDISRVESGKLILNPTVFSLSEMLDNLQNILRAQIEIKALNFKINRVHLDVDCLYADDLRLNQIFLNILSNAVKYTPSGGSVTLTMREEPADENHVRLIYTVEDTGIGMDEEFLKTIFDPFTRVKDSRIDTIEGSGLGMTIVKQMVDAMDGNITVESKVGEGSVFRVELELQTAMQLGEAARQINDGEAVEKSPLENPTHSESTAEESEEIPENEFAGMKLLIAEDNDLNWEIIHELLSYYEIETERAANGQICVDMLNAAQPGTYRAVLMDIQMPIMDGLEAAKTIRASEDPNVRDIPIIAMTADAFAENVRACREVGMDGHVAKPIDMKLLMQRLRELLQINGN